MTASTLAALFDACSDALRSGRAGDAIDLLSRIDAGALSGASAALHESLLRRATNLAGTSLPSEIDLSACDREDAAEGVSLVGACMNREANLLKVLPSWLASGADEIIVVDWGSRQPLWPQLAHIDDPRLKVVRIDGEPRWILTHAFNVGLRMARHARIFKLDADIELAPGFLERNRFERGEFIRGFWKSAVDAGQPDQRYTNGSFGAFKDDLRAIGYYNERIQTYGWDDSDLYARLSGSLGRAGRLLAHDSLTHLHQEEAQRLENQAVQKSLVMGRFAPTEHENLVNKYHELTSLEWASYHAAQDYRLRRVESRLWVGHRTTTAPTAVQEERDLARVLAMRQLATWRGDLLPPSAWAASCSLEFARLLRQAQQGGQMDRLLDALQHRRGLHVVVAADAGWRQVVDKTLQVIHQHRQDCGEVLTIVADDGFRPGETAAPTPQVLRASSALVDELVRTFGLSPRTDLTAFEATLAQGPSAPMTCWRVDAASVAASAIAHADTIATNLSGRFRLSSTLAPRTAFATSVYDEMNLLRLLEYLACVSLNLEVVEHLVLMYEARNGLFQLATQSMVRQMGVAPWRLSLVPFDRRPNFEELFSLQDSLPPGTLLVVGNADVAFDGSLVRLAQEARDDHVYVLSRWDIDDSGRGANLIRLESGVPNTFSADAWIARTPFRPDFWMDYGIGSFHCDSFINHQLSRSQRYRWANPCLDVQVFHLHDSRFNSSAEKHVRDQEIIQQRYAAERARNQDRDPVMGAPWSTLEQAHIADTPDFLVNWRAKFLVLDFTHPQAQLSGLLWLHLLRPLFGDTDHVALVVRFREADLHGPLGAALAYYKAHFRLRGLFFEMDDAPFDEANAPRPRVLVRPADPRGLLDLMMQRGADAWAAQMQQLMAWAPEGAGVFQTRCSFDAALDSADTRRLIDSLRTQQPESHAALVDFLKALGRWSEPGMMVWPFLEDLTSAPSTAPGVIGLNAPRVSLVTSLFRGGEFLEGYLENAAEAARLADGEVILVDANCNGHDTEAIERFFHARPELRRYFDIVTLSKDPGLYACWQLGIERSRGTYLSNANLDDRRSPWHTRLLVESLDARPQLAAAAGSISAVFTHAPGGWHHLFPTQIWFENLGAREFGYEDLFLRNEDGSVRSHNILHCMPVWRRSLHERFGFFDEATYGTSADWAFWLRCAREGERFWLEPQAFGRYFVNPDSHNRRNDANGEKERRIIRDLIGIDQDQVIKQ